MPYGTKRGVYKRSNRKRSSKRRRRSRNVVTRAAVLKAGLPKRLVKKELTYGIITPSHDSTSYGFNREILWAAMLNGNMDLYDAALSSMNTHYNMVLADGTATAGDSVVTAQDTATVRFNDRSHKFRDGWESYYIKNQGKSDCHITIYQVTLKDDLCPDQMSNNVGVGGTSPFYHASNDAELTSYKTGSILSRSVHCQTWLEKRGDALAAFLWYYTIISKGLYASQDTATSDPVAQNLTALHSVINVGSMGIAADDAPAMVSGRRGRFELTKLHKDFYRLFDLRKYQQGVIKPGCHIYVKQKHVNQVWTEDEFSGSKQVSFKKGSKFLLFHAKGEIGYNDAADAAHPNTFAEMSAALGNTGTTPVALQIIQKYGWKIEAIPTLVGKREWEGVDDTFVQNEGSFTGMHAVNDTDMKEQDMEIGT